MSNEKNKAASEDLQLDDLETSATGAEGTDATEKAKREPKVMTEEEIAALKGATAKVIELGVSEKFAKVLALVPVWHDKEANVAAKKELIDSFGGSEELKNYIDGEFQGELAAIGGLQKLFTTLNNIKSFYARREGTKKAKMTQVSIGGQYYEVNQDFLATLTDKSVEEKRSLLLDHPDTKKNESVEIL